MVPAWLQSNRNIQSSASSSSSSVAAVAAYQPPDMTNDQKNDHAILLILPPECESQTASDGLNSLQDPRRHVGNDVLHSERGVRWVATVGVCVWPRCRAKVVVFFVAPQVLKTGPVITCMAGCYSYTGGWAAAAARLQQEAASAFH